MHGGREGRSRLRGANRRRRARARAGVRQLTDPVAANGPGHGHGQIGPPAAAPGRRLRQHALLVLEPRGGPHGRGAHVEGGAGFGGQVGTLLLLPLQATVPPARRGGGEALGEGEGAAVAGGLPAHVDGGGRVVQLLLLHRGGGRGAAVPVVLGGVAPVEAGVEGAPEDERVDEADGAAHRMGMGMVVVNEMLSSLQRRTHTRRETHTPTDTDTQAGGAEVASDNRKRRAHYYPPEREDAEEDEGDDGGLGGLVRDVVQPLTHVAQHAQLLGWCGVSGCWRCY